jgi:hypothetical protein
MLGLGAGELDIYRVLLRRPGMSLHMLGGSTGLQGEPLRAAVERLRTLGLVDLQGGTLVAHPPDQALGRLVEQEQARLVGLTRDLDALRELLDVLKSEHQAARAPRGRAMPLELVEGGDVPSLLQSLMIDAEGDMLFLRPDQWRLSVGEELNEVVKQLLNAGRGSRALYPARALEEAPEVLQLRATAGEHVRVLAEVPTRLAILGTVAALVPERFGENNDRRLVVRQPWLVSALTCWFDSLWDRALPVPGLGAESPGGVRADERRLLLDQLAAGAKDEQIARLLGISLRTVRRRIAEVLDEVGAASRFQAGAEAVRRGWI